MSNLPNCPKCNSEYTYEDGILLVCPEGDHDFRSTTENSEDAKVVKMHMKCINDGDTVTVIKDLK